MEYKVTRDELAAACAVLRLTSSPVTKLTAQKAYWLISKELHPDVGGNHDDMKALNLSYQIVKGIAPFELPTVPTAELSELVARLHRRAGSHERADVDWDLDYGGVICPVCEVQEYAVSRSGSPITLNGHRVCWDCRDEIKRFMRHCENLFRVAPMPDMDMQRIRANFNRAVSDSANGGAYKITKDCKRKVYCGWCAKGRAACITIQLIGFDAYAKTEWGKMDREKWTEEDFQNHIVGLAARNGWLYYFTYDSRHSPPGYPDLTLVHSDTGRTIFAELKTEIGRIAPEQVDWGRALAKQNEYHLWRPSDWDAINDCLAGAPHPDLPEQKGDI